MNRTKIILSAIGVAAVVVPVIFLFWYSSNFKSEPQISEESREIDQKTIQDAVKKAPKQEVVFPSPSPSPATPQVSPSTNPANFGSTSQGSPSAR